MHRERTFEVRETTASPPLESDADLNLRLDNARQVRAEATAALIAAAFRGMVHPLRALPARWSRWRRQRRTGRALARCSDRILADVGIERKDIPLIAKGIDPRGLAAAPRVARARLRSCWPTRQACSSRSASTERGPEKKARRRSGHRPRGGPSPLAAAELRPSTSPSRAAARTAPSPGACSTACCRRNGSATKASAVRRRARSTRSCSPRAGLPTAPQAPRANLAELWRRVAELARPLQRSGIPRAALDATTQLLSPYQLNPLGTNPLRELLERLVDFERLRSARSLKLFIAATNLRTGAVRIFGTATSRPTRCWRLPACRGCSRRSRSTAKPTGMAATSATRRSCR